MASHDIAGLYEQEIRAMADGSATQSPPQQFEKPPFPQQGQNPPGLESEMTPAPDYGVKLYKGTGRLTGKAAIVTGGDSGIGRAVALAFAREGADVLIAFLPEEERDAQEALQAVQDAGRKGISVPGDIQNEQHCRELVERAVSEFGHLDILVNNAAFQMTHNGIEDLPSEEFERTFRTNVFAMFYLCKAALEHIREGGSIINLASVEAYKPEPTLLAYAATKGAIVTFTKGLAQVAIKQGVRVNAVAPGPVWTPLIPSTMPTEQVEQFGQQSPMGRPAQPAELAPAFVFLASPEASYVVGEVLGVHGGMPLGT
jgi:NAD(P)-dependent dehydrogenase (short-subunit alcohol dehydrogenase family)